MRSSRNNWHPCPICNRKFSSRLGLNSHKPHCFPGSTRFKAQLVPLTDNFYSHHRPAPLPDSSSGTLRNLPQPDDYRKIFDINGFDVGDYYDQDVDDQKQYHVPESALLLEAKNWNLEMDRKLSRKPVAYGKSPPTYKYLLKQEKIFELKDKAICTDEEDGTSSKGPIALGWIRDPLSGIIYANNWHTVMDLFNMMRDHKLSHAEGNAILDTFRRIAARSEATLIMPTTVDSVIIAVEKSSGGDTNKGVIEVTIPFSNIFFNGRYVDFGDAKAVGCMVNIFDLIMEWFCETSIDDYDTRPIELLLSDPDSPGSVPRRYYAGHATCDQFRAFCEAGVVDFGESFMPVSIQLQLDATVYENGGRKTLTPYYLRIMNFKERLFHQHKKSIKLAAFMPVILSTSEELKQMLTANGFHTKTDRADILRYLNRYIHQKFTEVVISEFQKYSINGAYLTFGNSDRNLKYVAVPLIMNLPNDNQERYTLLGLKHGQYGKRNCATCSLESNLFYKMGSLGTNKLTAHQLADFRRRIDEEPIRDATVHQFLCEFGENIWFKDITSKAQKALKIPVANELILTQNERDFSGRHGPVYAYNCQFQKCLLYNVMDYQIRNAIVTPITVSWFEVLHSVLKGVVELNFRFIMASIHLAVKNKIRGVNLDAIGIIDQRVKNFQVNQTYSLFGTKSVIVHKGLSPCFKDTKTTSDALSKAVMTGGNIDANRLAYYLFYLMMSIGSLGDCLPNHSIRLRIPPNGEFVVLNPTKVAIESASSALEELSILKGDMFSELSLSKLRYCVHVANARLKTLFLMKQGLGGFYTSSGEFHHIKPHGSSHSDQAIRGTGEPRAWDASPFESEHTVIKSLAPLTSRRSGTVQVEILKHSRNRDRASIIESSRSLDINATTAVGDNSLDEEITESVSDYVEEQDFSGSLTNSDSDRPSKCSIRITDSRGTLSYSLKRSNVYAKSAASAPISERLQSVILNAVLTKGFFASQQATLSAETIGRSKSKENLDVPFLHPFVKIPYLLENLTIYGESNQSVNNFLFRLRNGDSTVSLDLLSHFSVIPCGVKNPSPEMSDEFLNGGCIESSIFRFYATNEYVFQRGFAKKLDKLYRRYDCAMFRYKDSQDQLVIQPGRILGIVRLVDNNASNVLLSSLDAPSKKRSITSVSTVSSYSRRSTKTIFEKVSSSYSNSRKQHTTTRPVVHRQELPHSSSSIHSYKDEDDKILLLICWMTPENKGSQRGSFPYPYYKYDTISHGNQRVLYTQIVHPSSLFLPLYTIHDIDTRPDFAFEGSSMEAMINDRFWSFPFEFFRKLRRQYFGCFSSVFLFCDTELDDKEVVVDSNVADVVAEPVNVAEVAMDPNNCNDDVSEGGLSDDDSVLGDLMLDA